MASAGKRILSQTSGKSSFKREIRSKIDLLIKSKSSCKFSYAKRYKVKSRYAKTISSTMSKRKVSEFSGARNVNNSLTGKRLRRTMQNVSAINTARKKSTLQLLPGKPSPLGRKGDGKNAVGGIKRIEKRRKRKRKKEHIQLDEASRLQRRTRYLLIKMKLEQNLIDAYSAEGWKGQSREKIKPEKELQRAMKQILRCKIGIRDAIRQLELLSSEGCIEDEVINPDGSIFHEHIFCSKCKSRDVFPDNDIILCDGTCNCAFHQKCLEPPLATENIPPGDQGWLCKFCECKMEILEAVNAHLGTRFTANSNWQDIFKEAATAPDRENASVGPVEEWPSDDSKDEDYNPEMTKMACSGAGTDEDAVSDDASSSSSLFWLSGETSSPSNILNGGFEEKNKKRNSDGSSISVSSDEPGDREIMSHRRQRKDVDYKQLYDASNRGQDFPEGMFFCSIPPWGSLDEQFGSWKEMFGKFENEQLSEDEDWGPCRRKRRGKVPDAGIVVSGGNDKSHFLNKELRGFKKKLPPASQDRKPPFRIPRNAVEKLRQAFAENELPSRAVRESLSKQLGIAFEKVNKWFKNARYMALKIRKIESRKQLSSIGIIKASNMETVKNRNVDQAASTANSHQSPSSTTGVHVPKHLRRIRLRRNRKPMTNPLKKKWNRATDTLPSNTVKVSNGIHCKKRTSSSKRKLSLDKSKWETTCHVNETRGHEQVIVEMERLFCLEDRIEKLKKFLRTCTDKYHESSNETLLDKQLVIYIPVAEVRDKV